MSKGGCFGEFLVFRCSGVLGLVVQVWGFRVWVFRVSGVWGFGWGFGCAGVQGLRSLVVGFNFWVRNAMWCSILKPPRKNAQNS